MFLMESFPLIKVLLKEVETPILFYEEQHEDLDQPEFFF